MSLSTVWEVYQQFIPFASYDPVRLTSQNQICEDQSVMLVGSYRNVK